MEGKHNHLAAQPISRRNILAGLWKALLSHIGHDLMQLLQLGVLQSSKSRPYKGAPPSREASEKCGVG